MKKEANVLLNIKIKLLNPNACIPARSNYGDAGWDLYSAARVTIAPGATKIIPTGIAMEIPYGWYGQIKSRSGLGAKGLVITAGVVDSGYRGEIGVVAINTHIHTNNESTDLNEDKGYFTFKPGDKIAQMVFLPVPEIKFEVMDSLEETVRGENGFGSTDLKADKS